MQSTGLIPKTAMPNAYKFENFYKPYVNQEDVFVITIVISMEFSQTKLQAQMAAENLGMKNVSLKKALQLPLDKAQSLLSFANL